MLVTVQIDRADCSSKKGQVTIYIYLVHTFVVGPLYGSQSVQYQAKAAAGNAIANTLGAAVNAGAGNFL
jgi:fucose 4-O-acetylase-like acetyltransferase